MFLLSVTTELEVSLTVEPRVFEFFSVDIRPHIDFLNFLFIVWGNFLKWNKLTIIVLLHFVDFLFVLTSLKVHIWCLWKGRWIPATLYCAPLYAYKSSWDKNKAHLCWSRWVFPPWIIPMFKIWHFPDMKLLWSIFFLSDILGVNGWFGEKLQEEVLSYLL